MQREPSRISSGRRLKLQQKKDIKRPLDKTTMAFIVKDLMKDKKKSQKAIKKSLDSKKKALNDIKKKKYKKKKVSKKEASDFLKNFSKEK